jgi:hypothetical protein
MLTLRNFLTEENKEDKLKHLEHLEDHTINAGAEGFAHAYHTLNGVHDKLRGIDNETKITTKYDGSPSIVFGTHPETKKFFVGSKSVFNKNPKINYTPEDIEKNHGHAPGLVSKLKTALEHLPKIHDGKGVYQADIMHTPDTVRHEGHRVSHKTQLITYHHEPNSEHAKKAVNSKIGVAIHTAYEGTKFSDMKVKQGHIPELQEHEDVHQFPIHHEAQHVPYTKAMQDEYNSHIKKAMDSYRKAPKGAFEHAQAHQERLKVHINRSVMNGTSPSAEGYKKHITDHHAKEATKRKTEAGQRVQIEKGKRMSASVNDEHINAALEVHKHLQNAKNVLTNAMNQHQSIGHEIDGSPTNPEGYVVYHNNRPSKFVLRHEFSAMNLKSSEGGKKFG